MCVDVLERILSKSIKTKESAHGMFAEASK